MSLFDKLMGNATAVNIEELAKEFEPILIPEEVIESAFVVWRDKWIFTSKRLILLDIQGLTGGKREYMTIPYRSIDRYSIRTAGGFDDDCEMMLWIKGMPQPLIKEFKRNTDIKGLQRALSTHVL
ncbi:MAG: PH domain-containing protein [Alistipes sp.]|nr:PH domain-containing protein [Alistipes sp.]